MNLALDTAKAFKEAMRRLTSTVCIITCADASGTHGMTATAVTSVCADPSALLVCINHSSSFHAAIASADRFCVNLLDSSQAELSRVFSGKLKGMERFSVGQWSVTESGAPFLVDAQANLFCRTDRKIEYGTHTIFIGRVEAVASAAKISPLLYQDGAYAHALPLPAAA